MPCYFVIPNTGKEIEIAYRKFDENGQNSRTGKYSICFYQDFDNDDLCEIFMEDKISRRRIGEGYSEHCAIKAATINLRREKRKKIAKVAAALLDEILDEIEEDALDYELHEKYVVNPHAGIGMYLSDNSTGKTFFYGKDIKGEEIEKYLKEDFPDMTEPVLWDFSEMFKYTLKAYEFSMEEYREEIEKK